MYTLPVEDLIPMSIEAICEFELKINNRAKKWKKIIIIVNKS